MMGVPVSVAARREREREARRHHILDAAQRVFYARGFDLATMDDVALEAQLGKGTLYLYFRTKEDLLVGVATRHQQEIIRRFEDHTAGMGIERVRGMLLDYANHMAHPQEHLKMVVARWAQATPLANDATCASSMREDAMRIFDLLRDAVERGQKDRSVRDDVEPARLTMHLWGGVNGALLLRLKLDCVEAPNPLSSHLPSLEESIALLLDAVRPRFPQ